MVPNEVEVSPASLNANDLIYESKLGSSYDRMLVRTQASGQSVGFGHDCVLSQWLRGRGSLWEENHIWERDGTIKGTLEHCGDLASIKGCHERSEALTSTGSVTISWNSHQNEKSTSPPRPKSYLRCLRYIL